MWNNSSHILAMNKVCFQVQLQKGGTHTFVGGHEQTAFINLLQTAATFEGSGYYHSNATVLEALIAESDNGFIEGKCNINTPETSYVARSPLSMLNVQKSRAVQLDNAIMIVVPAEAKCEFQINEWNERAVLGAEIIKCALAAAKRIYPAGRSNVALRLAGMDMAELKASCSRANIDVFPCTDSDSKECNFAFATEQSAIPPTFQQRDKHSCSLILQSDPAFSDAAKKITASPTSSWKPCTVIVLLITLAVVVGLIAFYITINQ